MPLSDLQRGVAGIVFQLAESEGFVLAGGGALIAHDVVDRTTKDLDCFGSSRIAVDRLWPAIVEAVRAARFDVEVRTANHGFAKLLVTDPMTMEVTQVDIGSIRLPRRQCRCRSGRCAPSTDLAADKLLALFGRI
jgi:hypothetical protein